MAWPSSAGLSKANFDAGTDSPANARAELEALYDHVLLISNEVTDSATVWHSGNDGATSGLDADLLDGQHGSYYRDADNINAGELALAHIPTNLTGKNADQLDGQEGSYYTNSANHTGTTTVDVNTDSLTVNGSAITDIGHITKMYAGRVDSGGTTGSSNLPSGWTVSKTGSDYTITHSLNTTDVTFIGTCEGSTRKITIDSRSTSTIVLTTTDSSNNVAADASFDFILIVN